MRTIRMNDGRPASEPADAVVNADEMPYSEVKSIGELLNAMPAAYTDIRFSTRFNYKTGALTVEVRAMRVTSPAENAALAELMRQRGDDRASDVYADWHDSLDAPIRWQGSIEVDLYNKLVDLTPTPYHRAE